MIVNVAAEFVRRCMEYSPKREARKIAMELKGDFLQNEWERDGAQERLEKLSKLIEAVQINLSMAYCRLPLKKERKA